MTARILGRLTVPVVEGFAFHDEGDRLVIEATTPLHGFATGSFADPAVAASFDPSGFLAPSVSMVGFAYTQFALPVRAEPGGNFDFGPAANLLSPSVVTPLLLSSTDGRVELLAPMNAWHEQVIAVDRGASPSQHRMAFRWGWHGDLDDIEHGFRTELGIFTGTSAREVFAAWGRAIRSAAGTQRPTADADPLLTHLSYWTDNGAAYWYRTEPGADLPSTLQAKIRELDELGYLPEVPPTGMLSWTPRADVLPDGIEVLRRELGDRPLVLHSRHISPKSPSATGLNLLWCMALPGDFAATVELSNVIAIRTSDDYRFAEDPALLWVWYLTVNRMADALELPVFKDCFFSSADPGESEIDGDPHAELEALLAAMSGGVVGIGDRIGRTDVDVLSRVCRPDGRLVGPDQPIALTDRSFVSAGLSSGACWASTTSGDWTYLVAINTTDDRITVSDTFDLAELGLGEHLVYEWRRATAELTESVAVELEAGRCSCVAPSSALSTVQPKR